MMQRLSARRASMVDIQACIHAVRNEAASQTASGEADQNSSQMGQHTSLVLCDGWSKSSTEVTLYVSRFRSKEFLRGSSVNDHFGQLLFGIRIFRSISHVSIRGVMVRTNHLIESQTF